MHTKGKPLAAEIDLDTLAAGTPGFTGADLANLVNEAALLAARRGKKTIEMIELRQHRDISRGDLQQDPGDVLGRGSGGD